MLTKKWLLTASGLTVLGLLIASCAPAAPAPTPQQTAAPSKAETPAAKPAVPGAPSPTPKPAAEQPKHGGVLTWAQAAEPASFDIHQESGAQHPLYLMPAYNGLLQHDPLAWPEAKLIADLAASWEVSPDGLDYTFRLKSGVKWHDGKSFTSEDVRASLDRVREPPKGVRSPRQAAFRPITRIETPSADTLTIRLQRPSASFLVNLGTDWLAMLPKHVLDAKGDMKKDIMGTGPFKFKGSITGVSYEYVKNSDYFVKDRPYLDGLAVYLIRDEATRFAALRTGRVLFLPHPYGVSTSQGKMAEEDSRLVVQRTPRTSLYHLAMNLEKAPWSDPRVRRAVALSIDRQAYVATVFEGAGLVGAQMLPRGPWAIPDDEILKMPGYRQPKDADIAEAKRLLAEAGFAQGLKVTITARTDMVYEKTGTFVIAELAKIGIKGELAAKVTAAFDDALVKGAFELVCTGTGTALDDPDLRFGDLYVTGAGRNYGKYSSPKIDELYEKQSQALDENERKKLVREMLMTLQQDNPDVSLAWGITQIAHSSRMKNYKLPSSNGINSKNQEVWLAN